MSHKDNLELTISSVITATAKQLQQELIERTVAHQHAWWLLEALTKQKKTNLLLAKNIDLSDEQRNLLKQWIDDIVIHHKPIAYILGSIPFGPLSLTIRPPILIPRPETEEWALCLIEQIKQRGAQKLRILDLCTGSGCIALLFAHMLPDAHIDAVDISDDAIALATENMNHLNIPNVTIIKSNLFDQLSHKTYDLIVSNPPYITADEYKELAPSVQAWEDKRALYAQDEGLAIIKQIIDKAPSFSNPNKIVQEQQINQLYIEIGWKQGDIVSKLMKRKGYTNITITKDSAEKDRVVSGRIVNVATANIKS